MIALRSHNKCECQDVKRVQEHCRGLNRKRAEALLSRINMTFGERNDLMSGKRPCYARPIEQRVIALQGRGPGYNGSCLGFVFERLRYFTASRPNFVTMQILACVSNQ